MKSFKNRTLWIVLGWVAGLMPVATQAAPAGAIIFVVGDAQIVAMGGAARSAEKNTVVNEGDTLLTGKHGAIHVRMNDSGFISVRPDTRLIVQSFVWNGKEDGLERSVLLLLRGGFRTITGVIGRRTKENYLVNTPTATIGIRGTDHEPHYIEPGAMGDTAQGEPGTYNKVNVGATFIRNTSGTVACCRASCVMRPCRWAGPIAAARWMIRAKAAHAGRRSRRNWPTGPMASRSASNSRAPCCDTPSSLPAAGWI